MPTLVKIQVDHHLFLRDPEQTDLGRRMVSQSIALIDEAGFEKFTFRKLAQCLNSTEASVYRYFENKHQLLLYLVSWYWNWLAYQINYHTHNIKEPAQKLQSILKILSESIHSDPHFSHIDESSLGRIVISESTKAYLTKEFRQDTVVDLFSGYHLLCEKLVVIIQELNAGYPHPRALASTVIEVTQRQLFFSSYLPFLTELKTTVTDKNEVMDFVRHIVENVLDVTV